MNTELLAKFIGTHLAELFTHRNLIAATILSAMNYDITRKHLLIIEFEKSGYETQGGSSDDVRPNKRMNKNFPSLDIEHVTKEQILHYRMVGLSVEEEKRVIDRQRNLK